MAYRLDMNKEEFICKKLCTMTDLNPQEIKSNNVQNLSKKLFEDVDKLLKTHSGSS